MSDRPSLSSPSPSPAFLCDYSDWSLSFSIVPSVYMLAFLVGCLGNGLVLWAYLDRAGGSAMRTGDRARNRILCCSRIVSTCPRNNCSSSTSSSPASISHPSRSLTDSLIASLALADLCFLVTLPLWAVYTAIGYHWPFGQPLCQLSSFLTALNMYASVFSLSVLSVERYRVLTGHRPASHRALQTCPSRSLWVLGGLWAVAGVLALPGLLLRSVREVEPEDDASDPGSAALSCQMDYSLLIGAEVAEPEREQVEMMWMAAFSLKSTLIGFLLPLVTLLVCYCSLAQLLSKHFGRGPRPDRRRQQRLLRVIVSLVLAFFLCWLPLHINKTISMLLEFGFIPYSCSLDQFLLAAHPYVTCVAYLNSCLNPLLYAAGDPTFRERCRGAVVTLCSGRGGGQEEQEDEGKEARQEETADQTDEVEDR
ncbi:apelin receptor 2 [Brachionichthys hirsutus]|uniref:apelin receptor 2 n=1 Tax=Brachionichthys hirsutus TaxID=412623 RepID=UPI003604FBF4